MTFLSAVIATFISIHVFSFLFLIIISGLFAVTSVSVCTSWFHNTVTSSCSHTGLGVCVCVCHFSVVSIPSACCCCCCCCCAQNGHFYFCFHRGHEFSKSMQRSEWTRKVLGIGSICVLMILRENK
jgi:hypothetical protein